MTTTPTIWLDRSVPNYTLSGPGGVDQTHGRGIGLFNGNFLIVWETNVFEDIDGTSRKEIWGEIFDPRGVSVSGEIQLAGLANPSFLDFETPEVVADDSGGFFMAYEVNPNNSTNVGSSWLVTHFDSEGSDIAFWNSADLVGYFKYFDIEVGLLDGQEAYFTGPGVLAPDGDGSFVVAQTFFGEVDFLDSPDRGPLEAIALGGPGDSPYTYLTDSNIDVTEDTQEQGFSDPAIDLLKNNSAVVTVYEMTNPPAASGVRQTHVRVHTSFHISDGESDAPVEIRLADQPDVATLHDSASTGLDVTGSGNNFVVVYRTYVDTPGGADDNVRGRVFNAVTGELTQFEIDTGTGDQSKPRVAALNDGGFVVAWIEENSTGERDVYLQRFTGDGFKVGNEVMFSNPGGLYVWDIDLETLPNGRVLLTVSDDDSNRGIAYAIYNVNGNHITGTDQGEPLTANTEDSILEGLGGDDTMLGLDGDDWMSGGTGTDSFDGGGGNDTVDFTYSNSDWTVSLLTGTAVAGSTTETLVNIENVNTGGGDDTITGDNGINILKGNGGDDTIVSGRGADDIDGGSGEDWADYRTEWTGLALAPFGDRTYDLKAGEMRWENVTGTGAGGYVERMVNIENIGGSSYNDTFIANFLPNYLVGYGGDDVFKSADVGITSDFLSDTYNGGSGIDTADFSAIMLDEGETTSSRSFAFVLSPLVPAAPAGTVRENGGGLVAQLFSIENLRGTGFNDTIEGNNGANTLNGGGGDDILQGLGGADDLRGGDGNDVLVGGAGVDIFSGGEGTDTADYSATSGSATYDLAQQKFIGSITETWSSIENVIAGSGNDTLIGGTGINVMNGGAGDDLFQVNDAGDIVVEATGQGNDRVIASFSYVLTAGAEVETLSVSNIFAFDAIDLTGNLLSQTIIGNLGRNLLNGGGPGGAADIMRGLGGNDTYRVNNSADVIEESVGGGIDTVRTAVNYVLGTGVEVERLLALAPASNKALSLTGNDFSQTITGNAGGNVLTGLGGDDTIIGLAGADTIDGGDGNDTLSYAGSAAGVTITLGRTYVGGDAEGDVVSNIEHVTGSSFVDKLVGSGISNKLNGGDGDDEIRGEGGQDDLTGGNGDDRFTYLSTTHSASGVATRDRIMDFSQVLGNRDIINLNIIDAQASNGVTSDAFSFIGLGNFTAEGQIRVFQSGADTVVQMNTTGNDVAEMEILLVGVTATNITAADFIL